MKELIRQMVAGDRRALSRLLSIVEQQDDRSFQVLEQVWSSSGKAVTVGITGPAGAGKSTFIDQLVKLIRAKNFKVGVIAVDPSSPFSGGAVLGDRVRMQRHAQDPGVFIRSVSSRGKSGGVSFATRALIQLMDAYGCDFILIETVGAGQSETEIMNLVDTTLVLLMPEAGDSIQALKAGILEIANIYVVNKKDRPGADRVVTDIQNMLSLVPDEKPWNAPVLLTEAVSGEGLSEVWDKVLEHRDHLKKSDLHDDRKKQKRWKELLDLAQVKFASHLISTTQSQESWKNKIESNETNIYKLADELLEEVGASLVASRPKASNGK